MSFTLEEIYNCSRAEFCERTGTSMEEMRDRLKKEVSVLIKSFCHHHEIFRNGGSITDDGQRQLLKLLNAIDDKIQAKQSKIKDIEKRLES